jgi:hypothetical protein
MSPSNINDQEAYEIGVEAYHYFFPLILMDVSRRVMTNLEPGMKPGMGPMNAFFHFSAFPPANFREVVRPNFDTLYSIAWLDLTKEPMVVSAPDTEGRYYMLPMLDMWSDVFAVPGMRTSGTGAGHWAVTPPGWKGPIPSGVSRIEATTSYVWIIGRTQTNGPADYPAVHKVQAGYKVTPLSHWGRPVTPVKAVIDPTIDMKTPPMVQVDTMPADQYFSYGAELMRMHPPHATDWSQISRFKRVGIEPGESFDYNGAPLAVKEGLKRAVTEGKKQMRAKTTSIGRIANGWMMLTETMGVYGNAYLKLAVVAMVGLGANQPEDAIYPLCVGDSEGRPLEGSNRYVLHFPKGELPPVGAFWSVTMYDSEGFPTPNTLDRFAIGDRDELKFNADGSLDIYIQNMSPGGDKESNWLPCPAKGALAVTMRLYAPMAQILDGRWVPPPVREV